MSFNLFFVAQLIVEGIVGTAVFVRCFVDRQRLVEQVMDKLGNGFTRAPFASVVVWSSSQLDLAGCIYFVFILYLFCIYLK